MGKIALERQKFKKRGMESSYKFLLERLDKMKQLNEEGKGEEANEIHEEVIKALDGQIKSLEK